jgi:sulfur dioxygenase
MNNQTEVRSIESVISDSNPGALGPWKAQMIRSDQCLSYVAWNTETREAVLIDPKDEDIQAYRAAAKELSGYRWVAVVDTHTHADHVSCAAEIAAELNAPLVMSALAPSPRVDLKVNRSTTLVTQAGRLELVITPGHTPDSITPIWGPFIFGGDTILYGDVGRDDLPGGNPSAHFESIEKLKVIARPEMLMLPGHDHKGGRASKWSTQLQLNSSLTQGREDFVREAAAFDAPAPALLKKSLRENFK